MTQPTLQDVLAALTGPTTSVTEATAPSASGGVPSLPGLYAWWIRRSALPIQAVAPHPTEPRIELLYLGIAKARATSSQTLRSRVISNHLRGNIGASTFRFSLAALLIEELDLVPKHGRTRVQLTADDNRRLSQWQAVNLRLAWATAAEPWVFEATMIERLAHR